MINEAGSYYGVSRIPAIIALYMEAYTLEKEIWTDDDLPTLELEDGTIWSMLADPEAFEFLVDMDYIFRIIEPAPGKKYLRIWLAPVTVVFGGVFDVKIDIESQQGDIEIAEFQREHPRPTPNGKFTTHTYRFVCWEGEISLSATSFTMYMRRPPVFTESRQFSLKERNGVSFGRTFELADPR